jgi:hypothetical protein
MKTRKFNLWLSAILIAYSLLYIATSKTVPCDNPMCQKMENITNALRNRHPYFYSIGECRDSVMCAWVKDTTQINWNAFADTVCLYLNSESLLHYSTIVINVRGDTLARKKCP